MTKITREKQGCANAQATGLMYGFVSGLNGPGIGDDGGMIRLSRAHSSAVLGGGACTILAAVLIETINERKEIECATFESVTGSGADTPCFFK